MKTSGTLFTLVNSMPPLSGPRLRSSRRSQPSCSDVVRILQQRRKAKPPLSMDQGAMKLTGLPPDTPTDHLIKRPGKSCVSCRRRQWRVLEPRGCLPPPVAASCPSSLPAPGLQGPCPSLCLPGPPSCTALQACTCGAAPPTTATHTHTSRGNTQPLATNLPRSPWHSTIAPGGELRRATYIQDAHDPMHAVLLGEREGAWRHALVIHDGVIGPSEQQGPNHIHHPRTWHWPLRLLVRRVGVVVGILVVLHNPVQRRPTPCIPHVQRRHVQALQQRVHASELKGPGRLNEGRLPLGILEGQIGILQGQIGALLGKEGHHVGVAPLRGHVHRCLHVSLQASRQQSGSSKHNKCMSREPLAVCSKWPAQYWRSKESYCGLGAGHVAHARVTERRFDQVRDPAPAGVVLCGCLYYARSNLCGSRICSDDYAHSLQEIIHTVYSMDHSQS